MATAQGRATIEPGHTNGSGGASLDYKNGDLNFGGMGYYEKEVITDKYDASNYRVEGYAKYDNKLRLAAGTEGNETVKYYYAKLDYNGNRTVENSNLQFTGALSSEIGRYDVDLGEYGSFNITNIELKARGGVYFKADDISASLNGNFGYGCAIDHSETDPKEKYIQNVNASLFGSVAKGRVRVSTMLSVFKDSDSSTANTSANVTVEYKNLREGLTPFLYYTVNNMLDGRQHEVGGGLGLKF